MRWYSQGNLEDLRRLVAESGFGERQHGGRGRLQALLDALPGRARPKDGSLAGAVKRCQEGLVSSSVDDNGGDIDSPTWEPPSERHRQPERRPDPLPVPDVCPVCAVEVEWVAKRLPGGGVAPLPVCERHGRVSLTEEEELNLEHCAHGGR
jgi:hypothetical protein